MKNIWLSPKIKQTENAHQGKQQNTFNCLDSSLYLRTYFPIPAVSGAFI